MTDSLARLLSDNAARRHINGGRKILGFGERKAAADLFQCLSYSQLLTIDQAVTLIERLDRLGREATPLESDRVEAMCPGRIAVDHDKGGRILGDNRTTAGHGVGTEITKLMDGRQSTQDGKITQRDVAGQRNLIGQDTVVADDTVVPYMHIGHEQVTRTDGGFAAILNGTTMQGSAFTHHVIIAHDQTCRLTGILLVLTILTHRSELKDPRARTQYRRALDDHVRPDTTSGTNLDIGSDHAVGPDLDIFGQARSGVDDGGGMYQETFLSAQMIVPSQTNSSSTVARQANFQMPRFSRSTCADRTRRSPGITGRLKRTLSLPTR